MSIKKLNEELKKLLDKVEINESAPEAIFAIEFMDSNHKLKKFTNCEIWFDYDLNSYYLLLPFVDDKLTNMNFNTKEEAYEYAIKYLKHKYAGSRYWRNSNLAKPDVNFI